MNLFVRRRKRFPSLRIIEKRKMSPRRANPAGYLMSFMKYFCGLHVLGARFQCSGGYEISPFESHDTGTRRPLCHIAKLIPRDKDCLTSCLTTLGIPEVAGSSEYLVTSITFLRVIRFPLWIRGFRAATFKKRLWKLLNS